MYHVVYQKSQYSKNINMFTHYVCHHGSFHRSRYSRVMWLQEVLSPLLETLEFTVDPDPDLIPEVLVVHHFASALQSTTVFEKRQRESMDAVVIQSMFDFCDSYPSDSPVVPGKFDSLRKFVSELITIPNMIHTYE